MHQKQSDQIFKLSLIFQLTTKSSSENMREYRESFYYSNKNAILVKSEFIKISMIMR